MKTSLLKNLLISFAALFLVVDAQGGVKGVGRVSYSGVFGPSKVDKNIAFRAAQLNALSNYGAKLSKAAYVSFQRVEGQLKEQIEKVFLSVRQLDASQDKTTKTYTVVIEADLNGSYIDSLMDASLPAKSQATASGEEVYMVFAFVSRKLQSKKLYDDKRTNIAIENSEGSNSEDRRLSETSANIEFGSKIVKQKTTGGTTEKKAAGLVYTVSTSTEVDNAVNKVLSTANFETVTAIDAGLDVDALKSDYGTGNDISPTTRRNAVKLCRENEVAFLAVANMDVGLPEKDPITGLIRVYVSVTGKISDLRKRFPKTVASLEGKPYAGVGSNAEVAEKNALNAAASRSAQDLVEQLRAKGITL